MVDVAEGPGGTRVAGRREAGHPVRQAASQTLLHRRPKGRRREPEVVAGRDGPGEVGDRSQAALEPVVDRPVRGEPAGHGLRLESGDGDALTVDRVEGAQRVTDDEQPGRPAAAEPPTSASVGGLPVDRDVGHRLEAAHEVGDGRVAQPVEEVLEAGGIPGRTFVAEPRRGDHPLSALHRQGESGGAVLGATEHHHPGPHREGAALLVETAGIAHPRIDLVDAALRQLRQPSIEPRPASRGVHHDLGGHRGDRVVAETGRLGRDHPPLRTGT